MSPKLCSICGDPVSRGEGILEPYLSTHHTRSFFHVGLDEIIETAVRDGTARLCCRICAGGASARRERLTAAADLHWDRL